MEYFLEEIIERYKLLKDSNNNSTILYNVLVYILNCLKEERSDKVIEYERKLKNLELMQLQNDLYNALNYSIIKKLILLIYLKIYLMNMQTKIVPYIFFRMWFYRRWFKFHFIWS